MNRYLAVLLLLIPVPLAQLLISDVKADAQEIQVNRVADNIRRVQYGQDRDSVVELLGPPVNKSEFESDYWPQPGSLMAMQVVDADWWFDGREVYIVQYKEQGNRLIVCTWGKARKLK